MRLLREKKRKMDSEFDNKPQSESTANEGAPWRVIPQQAVIRKIIAVTDAHSVLVSTRSALTAAIAAMKVDSAQKVSEWLFSRTMVNIAKVVISSVVVISLVSRAGLWSSSGWWLQHNRGGYQTVHRVVIVPVSQQ